MKEVTTIITVQATSIDVMPDDVADQYAKASFTVKDNTEAFEDRIVTRQYFVRDIKDGE